MRLRVVKPPEQSDRWTRCSAAVRPVGVSPDTKLACGSNGFSIAPVLLRGST